MKLTSGQTRVVGLDIEEAVRKPKEPIRVLPMDAAQAHFSILTRYLGFAHEWYRGHKDTASEISQYIDRLKSSLDLLLRWRQVRAIIPDQEAFNEIKIKPESSGWPLALGEFSVLGKCAESAELDLQRIPLMPDLVDMALDAVYRGAYPDDAVQLAQARKLLEDLIQSPIVSDFEILPLHEIGREPQGALYSQTVLKFNMTLNIPFIYELTFRGTMPDHLNIWYPEMIQRIKAGLDTLRSNEMQKLAREVETVNGVQVLKIMCHMIGPICTRHTRNTPEIDEILSHGAETDAIFLTSTEKVGRMKERPYTGLGGYFRRWSTRDTQQGIFSPTISDGLHALLPHRMLQYAEQFIEQIYKNVTPHAITDRGDIL